jgi:hypothetical protein
VLISKSLSSTFFVEERDRERRISLLSPALSSLKHGRREGVLSYILNYATRHLENKGSEKDTID